MIIRRKKKKKGQEPAKIGWQVPETTVSASLPSELPSPAERIKYTLQTGTTASEWKNKQHPKMVEKGITPIMGSPKVIGVGGTLSTATKGFNLAKKVTTGVPLGLSKAIDGAVEAKDLFELIVDRLGKKKKNKKSKQQQP